MLDAVLNSLIEKLVESLLNEGRHVLQFHDEFEVLKDALLFMQGYVKDAEKARVENQKETVKVAVQELKELLYNAEDLISDCELFLTSKRMKMASKYMNYFSPSYMKFRYKMGKKLGEINQEIRVLNESMRNYIPTAPTVPNPEQSGINRPVIYPVLTNDAEVVGLKDDAEKIIEWLSQLQGSFNVIGIVGMGGIGKTTLAQKILSNVRNDFDSVLMVTVSQTLKFEELINNMLRKLNVDIKDLANVDVKGLLEEVRDRLEGNRCLVILDDVWDLKEGLWWESLKSALPLRNSCVIVTTRHEEVARSMGAAEKYIHRPQLLSDEESWSLFTKTAFGEQEGWCLNPELECIGRGIVAECERLPLGIKVVGGMMKGKGCSIGAWSRIYENLKEDLVKKDEPIFSVLAISYQELPSHLKPCILCLAMFPEDCVIRSDDIIPWWIGEGLIRGRGDDRRAAYEIAQEYIDELIGHCLLMGERMDRFEEHYYDFKIHDLVRHMIRLIAKEENFICFDDDDDHRGRPSCNRSRRVGMVGNTDMNLLNEIDFKLLRTIAGTEMEDGRGFCQNMGVKLCQLKWLRVLDISFSSSDSGGEWLNGIGWLKHLICLRINGCGLAKIPDSIGNLLNLQSLYLQCFSKLKGLPKSIAFLEKLTILSLCKCKSIEGMPKELGNLTNLEELSGLTVRNYDKRSFCVPDLKKMTKLRALAMEIHSNDATEEGDLKVLSELKQLRKLSLNLCQDYGMESKIQQQLSPLEQLTELYLEGYHGRLAPIWLNPTTLPNLLYLHLECCDFFSFSPELFGGGNEEVWKLEVVILRSVRSSETWGRIECTMPFLRFKRIIDCWWGCYHNGPYY